MEELRLLLVDAHPIMRDGLVASLGRHPDLVITASRTDGASALDLLGEAAVDVVLVAETLPDMTAAQFAQQVRRKAPDARCVVLAPAVDGVVRVLVAGARGYLLDDVTGGTIAAALRAVARGGCWLDPRAAAVVVATLCDEAEDAGPLLTDREVTILRYVAAGLPNGEIAQRIHLSTSSVKISVTSAMRKLGVRNRTEAVLVAEKRGLLQ